MVNLVSDDFHGAEVAGCANFNNITDVQFGDARDVIYIDLSDDVVAPVGRVVKNDEIPVVRHRTVVWQFEDRFFKEFGPRVILFLRRLRVCEKSRFEGNF
jgi:hypothetical protein